MAPADVVAIYGAVLATGLAVIQYRQWAAGRTSLLVVQNKEFVSIGDHLELTITNKSNVTIYVDFVGIGYDYTPWLKPWRRRFHELHSMMGVEGDCLSGNGAGGPIPPGASMEVYFPGRDFNTLQSHSYRYGFKPELSVWVDHSQSDVSQRKTIRVLQ